MFTSISISPIFTFQYGSNQIVDISEIISTGGEFTFQYGSNQIK